MQILGTGLNGLVGSRIVELLSDRYEFTNLSRTTGVDIANYDSLAKACVSSDASVFLHLAAKTDVDACEKDKDLGEQGEAWKINVEGTQNVLRACKETGKKIIYISTDFVFDGEINEGEVYDEDDTPHPINWYAETKYRGEQLVQKAGIPWCIARIAYPYRASFPKKDFFRAILDRLNSGQEVAAIADHSMSPTFVDDIAPAMDALLEHNASGMYHVVGSKVVSPYDAAKMIAKKFGLDQSLIHQTTREAFFAGRAKRPYHLALKNDKLKGLGVAMRGFDEGVEEIKKQLTSNT